MPSIGTLEVMPSRGTLPMERHPVAASQTLVVGDLVYLVSGQVTKCAASGSDVTSTTGIWGIMAQDSNSQAANTLVAVNVLGIDDLLVLPSFGTAPTIAIVGNGANTAGYTIRNDGGVYKINLSTTANPVVRARNLDLSDGRDATGQKFKATFSVGDRVICKVLGAARQF